MSSSLFSAALPEIFLACGSLALVMLGAVEGDRARRLIEGLSVALLIVVFGMVFFASRESSAMAFEGAFISDGFARLMKLLALAGSIAALLMSFEWLDRTGVQRYEFSLLVLLATLGMMMMISANDLIALYLGLELQSLALYVVAAIHRDNAKATEAGLKYFVLGALSSGMLLYGASLVYGFSGATSFTAIAAAVKGGASIGLVVGLVFVLAGSRLQDFGRAVPYVDAGRL